MYILLCGGQRFHRWFNYLLSVFRAHLQTVMNEVCGQLR